MENKSPHKASGLSQRRSASNSPTKKSVMSANRLNTEIANDTGLLSPPTSQLENATMMPSPPPEDVFRSGSRHSSANSRQGYLETEMPFTPSLLAGAGEGPGVKRKRTGILTPAPSFNTEAVNDNSAGNSNPEATPNPKPRKQSRVQTVQDSPTRKISPSFPLHRHDKSNHSTRPTSPTPKPRGTLSPSKKRLPLVASPHARNPEADFIPPIPDLTRAHLGSGSRRRSVTPGPAYEPPTTHFAAPREVIGTPVSASAKKKGRKKAEFKLLVKKEPPVIDLSIPLPPPSPTEDPILLSARRRSRASAFKAKDATNKSKDKKKVSIGDPGDPEIWEVSPPSKPSERAGSSSSVFPEDDGPFVSTFGDANQPDSSFLTSASELTPTGPAGFPFFENTGGTPRLDDGWTDSENEDANSEKVRGKRNEKENAFDRGMGEYTGRFTVMNVPTKADPPNTDTRVRMDRWGRPVSPFPRKHGRLVDVVEEELEEEREGGEREREVCEEEEDVLPTFESLNAESSGAEDDDEGVQHLSVEDIFAPSDSGSPLRENEVLEEEKIRDQEEERTGDVEMEDVSGELEEEERSGENLSAASNGGDVFGSQRSSRGRGEEDVSHTSTAFPENSADEGFSSRFGSRPSLDDELRKTLGRASSQAQRPTSGEQIQAPTSFSSTSSPSHLRNRGRTPEEEEEEREDAEDALTVSRELSREPDRPDSSSDEEDLEKEEESTETKVRLAPSSPVLLPASSIDQDFPPLRSTSGVRGQSSSPVEITRRSPSLRLRFGITDSRVLVPEFEDEDDVGGVMGTVKRKAKDKMKEVIDVDDEEDGEEDKIVKDNGLVTITSGDPRAAARAAAILKLHDYDCLTRIELKRRFTSVPTSPDRLIRNARRKSAIESGIGKHKTDAREGTPVRRRATLGGVVGDSVFIPGSPVTTLPALLKEAERGLEECVAHTGGTPVPVGLRTSSVERPRTPVPEFVVPATPARAVSMCSDARVVDGERAWSREDWKRLDACFTDERLARGFDGGLCNVDDVDVGKVVKRFWDFMGGEGAVREFGSSWTKETIERRVQALQKKQRSGNVAPPTPGGERASPYPGGRKPMVVPDFTPVNPSRLAWPPVGARKDIKRVPATLLGPRYSHLLEEAVKISREGPRFDLAPVVNRELSHENGTAPKSQAVEETVPETSVRAVSEESTTSRRSSLGGRMKGFLFSYLPTLSKKSQTPPSEGIQQQPGLPLPPPEVLNKPRGPVNTPVRAPDPKPLHPKDLVHLQPTPLPAPKPSGIPRAMVKRLVELHPAPAPGVASSPVVVPRERRDSGGSVKDLVRSYEEAVEEEGRGLKKVWSLGDLKRVRSVGDTRRLGSVKVKPVTRWRL